MTIVGWGGNMEFVKRHRQFFINTLICIITFAIVIIPLNIWINKKLDWYSLGKSAVYVFGIWFGASAVVAIIKYFVSKDDNK
jgi:hypothetical protein